MSSSTSQTRMVTGSWMHGQQLNYQLGESRWVCLKVGGTPEMVVSFHFPMAHFPLGSEGCDDQPKWVGIVLSTFT